MPDGSTRLNEFCPPSSFALPGKTLQHLDFFFEHKPNDVFIELHVHWGALLVMFPHLMAVSRIKPFYAQMRQQAGFLLIRVLLLFIRSECVYGVDVFTGDIINQATRFSRPQCLATGWIN